jgi:uncharacterized DUF497 family protein
MVFDWDDANRNHIAEHDVTVQEAEEVFENDPVDLEVQEHQDDGYRYRQIGETKAGRILVLLSTVREESVRIITGWDAPKAFKDFYLEKKARQSWSNNE